MLSVFLFNFLEIFFPDPWSIKSIWFVSQVFGDYYLSFCYGFLVWVHSGPRRYRFQLFKNLEVCFLPQDMIYLGHLESMCILLLLSVLFYKWQETLLVDGLWLLTIKCSRNRWEKSVEVSKQNGGLVCFCFHFCQFFSLYFGALLFGAYIFRITMHSW